MTADEIVDLLDLKPHPEGGYYRETWRAAAAAGGRPAGTAIYYLLKQGEASHWHCVDADEIWHFHAGEALELSISDNGRRCETKRLGSDLAAGERPQIVVRARHWQSAKPAGAWSLVSCTVSPGFSFEGFEMAPPGWSPG